MEKRSVRQYWPCSKIIFNILTVVLLVGCCKNQQTQYSSPKINNDTELSVLPLTFDNKVLHENILDYAHHMKYQDIENTDYKNLIRLTFAMNGDTVNYAIWPIRELFYLLANENLFVVNIDSIASALNFNKLQKYTSNVHQIQETAQNSLTSQAI